MWHRVKHCLTSDVLILPDKTAKHANPVHCVLCTVHFSLYLLIENIDKPYFRAITMKYTFTYKKVGICV